MPGAHSGIRLSHSLLLWGATILVLGRDWVGELVEDG